MNKFKVYFLFLSIGLILFSCTKSDTVEPVVIRDYAVQYNTDITAIEDYLKSTYIQEIVENPGASDDQDVTLAKIPTDGTQKSLWSYLQTETSDPNAYPKLLSKDVELHDITYKVYYLKLRADNPAGESPCEVDEVLASYVGSYLWYNDGVLTSSEFQSLLYPQHNLALYNTIKGWSEIFPLFKTGTYNSDSNPENPATFSDFGAGIIFIPSGLGYYNSAAGSVPAYSPLIFKIKLYNLKRTDLDGTNFSGDGIYSYNEDVNGNGDLDDDDTDGDGIPNYLDIDDDGDGKLTKNEIKDANGVTYSFESIPDCNGNIPDDPKLKRHLVKCN